MRGARAPWLLSLPVALAGSLAAHESAYALADPSAEAAAAHGYLAYEHVFAAALAVVAASLLWHALRGRAGARPSPWLFALLPPLAFTFQEHLERASLPLEVVPEPTFLLGLLLQVPFALLARFIALTLLHTAETLGARLRRPQELRRSTVLPLPVGPVLPLRPAVPLGRGQRAPPARA